MRALEVRWKLLILALVVCAGTMAGCNRSDSKVVNRTTSGSGHSSQSVLTLKGAGQ